MPFRLVAKSGDLRYTKRMRAACAAFLLCCPLAAAGADGRGGWHETLSPQIQVLHEATFLPRSFVMDVGRVHNRLKLDLAMFAPWMSKDRIRVFLYATRDSYLRGEFRPPAWSNGVAFADRKIIATFVQEPPRKTIEIIGHEMSHVLFESYWAEAGKPPPVWLNEGLAMLEEGAESGRPEESPWYQAMRSLSEKSPLPMERFLRMRPAEKDAEKDAVMLWYVQAYSVAHFLYRRHTRLQFYHLVKGLREGRGLEQLLWQVYRYRTLDDFEAAWRNWLKLPAVPLRLASGREGGGSASPELARPKARRRLDGFGFQGFGFKIFTTDSRR